MNISKGMFLVIYPMMAVGIFGSYITSFYNVPIEPFLIFGTILCIINTIISIPEWEDINSKDGEA